MTKTSLFNDLFKMAVLTVVVAVATPEAAFAQGTGDLNALVHSFSNNTLVALPWMLNTACYVGGLFMLTSGALKLKAHAENPTSEKLAPGVARLITGGAITSIPALTSVIQKSTTLSGTGATFNSFTVSF